MKLKIFICVGIIIIAGAILLLSQDDTIGALGRQTVDYRVIYLENSVFDENPQSTNFLMSFTDYIEIDSSFWAGFSKETDINYAYSAEKRFVIRTAGSNDIVFQQNFLLDHSTGQIFSDTIRFNPYTDDAGGTYTIFPKEYIQTYINFLAAHEKQMETEIVIPQNFRGFTAELLIDFIYTVQTEYLNETIIHGCAIPLTGEVFTINRTGLANFEWEKPSERNLPLTVLCVLAVAASLYFLLRFFQEYRANPQTRETDKILQKYHHEIIICDKPVNQQRYEPVNVPKFSELLKLSVNLNKHIRCFRNETNTEFSVIVDNYVYMFTVSQF